MFLMHLPNGAAANGHCGDSLCQWSLWRLSVSHAHTLKSREDEGSKLAHEVKFFLVLGFRDSGSLES